MSNKKIPKLKINIIAEIISGRFYIILFFGKLPNIVNKYVIHIQNIKIIIIIC